MVREVLVGMAVVLLLATNVAGASAQPYWIDTDVEYVYILSDVPAEGTTTIYAVHEAGYAPDIGATMTEGLRYYYYDGIAFNTFLGTDIDTSPAHVWASTVSVNGNAWETQSDTVSIYWEGWVLPDGVGTTTFYTKSDDGQRLYIDGVRIIDNWVNQGPTEKSASVDLQSIAAIKYEWYENTVGAEADLGWDSVNGAKVYPIPSEFLRCTKPGDTSYVVTDMEYYYKIEITNNEGTDLIDYQVKIATADLGINISVESWAFRDTVPEPPEPPEPEGPSVVEERYDPTAHGRYSQYIDMIFPYDGDISAWALIANVVSVWTVHVGDDMFWLFVLPLPILAYWIKTKSVELPTVIYLVLGGMFYGLAPDVMQTPARIMLMFGITGLMYHFFKNRG